MAASYIGTSCSCTLPVFPKRTRPGSNGWTYNITKQSPRRARDSAHLQPPRRSDAIKDGSFAQLIMGLVNQRLFVGCGCERRQDLAEACGALGAHDISKPAWRICFEPASGHNTTTPLGPSLTRVTKSYLSALGTTQLSSYTTKH